MKAVTRLHTLLALILALAGTGPLATRSAAAGETATQPPAEKEMLARPGLTSAEVDEAVSKASQLTPKMTVRQVEQTVGALNVAGKSGSLDDMVSALPRLPGLRLTATNGICRFEFTSNAKGRFLFTSWALLPGATPSH